MKTIIRIKSRFFQLCKSSFTEGFMKQVSCARCQPNTPFVKNDKCRKEIVETKKDLQDYLVDGVNNNISKGLASEMRDILLSL